MSLNQFISDSTYLLFTTTEGIKEWATGLEINSLDLHRQFILKANFLFDVYNECQHVTMADLTRQHVTMADLTRL